MTITLQGAGCSLGDGMYTSSRRHRWAESSPHATHPNLQNAHAELVRDRSKQAEWNMLAWMKGYVLPSDCAPAARFTKWSASSMASAGPNGRSRDRPITRMRISVSSSKGTSEHSRRKKLTKERVLERIPESLKIMCRRRIRPYFLSLSGGQLSHL